MIKILFCKDKKVEEGKLESLTLYKEKADLLWVDIEAAKDEDLACLDEIFSFHELAIEDCIFPSQPKIDEFHDHLFIVIYALLDSEAEITTEELNIFVGQNYVVTVHEKPVPVLTGITKKLSSENGDFIKRSDFLLHTIVDRVIDGFTALVNKIDTEIDKAEEAAATNPHQEVINDLFGIKKRTISLRRIIVPQQKVIRYIAKKESSIISDETIPYFDDICDHIEQMSNTLETYRDVTSNILQVCFSNISNKMAGVVKMLTVIATIIMPLTLITSYYGMNLPLPEFGWGIKGVLFALTIMTSITIGLLVYFRKMRWI
jgi:magnesium transporter